MLIFYVRHVIVVEKVHEVFLLKQSKWLEPHVVFTVDIRAATKNDFDKDVPKSLNCSLYDKTKEKFRSRLKMELLKRDDDYKLMKRQAKLTFNGIREA